MTTAAAMTTTTTSQKFTFNAKRIYATQKIAITRTTATTTTKQLVSQTASHPACCLFNTKHFTTRKAGNVHNSCATNNNNYINSISHLQIVKIHYGLVVQFYYYNDDHGQCHPHRSTHTQAHTQRTTTQLLKQHPPKRSLTLVYGQRNGLPTTKTHNTFCHQNTQTQTQIQTSVPNRCMICSQSIQKCITHQTPHTQTHTQHQPTTALIPRRKT